MEEENKDIQESETPEEEDTVEIDKEEFEQLKKQEEIAKNQKLRAEKAEVKLKKEKEKGVETPNFSIQDIKALTDVHDEDIEELQNFAKFKDISIAEAKATSIMQTYLKDRAEERRTAEVTDTKGGRPSTKISGETLIERAKTGQVPEDDAGIAKLAEARMEGKIKK